MHNTNVTYVKIVCEYIFQVVHVFRITTNDLPFAVYRIHCAEPRAARNGTNNEKKKKRREATAEEHAMEVSVCLKTTSIFFTFLTVAFGLSKRSQYMRITVIHTYICRCCDIRTYIHI